MGLLEKSAPESAKVRVFGVVDLHNAPRIDASPDAFSINFNLFL
jgi:hypothetical protein